jgi:hypothetical protein
MAPANHVKCSLSYILVAVSVSGVASAKDSGRWLEFTLTLRRNLHPGSSYPVDLSFKDEETGVLRKGR